MLKETYYTFGNDVFAYNTFDSEIWSAPCIVDASESIERLAGFGLAGRRIIDVRFVGHCYNLTELEPDKQFERWCDIDEQLLILLDRGGKSEDMPNERDVFAILVPQEPEFRIGMNTIPWNINAGTNPVNMDARVIFAPCIGRMITATETSTYIVERDPMFSEIVIDEADRKEVIKSITRNHKISSAPMT